MLKVSGICKKFRNRQILKGASFQAEPGTCVGIAGGNGCGKTTLLSILAGVSRPDAGSICLDGMEMLGKRRLFEEKTAYVPQENPLIPELSARDNLALWHKGNKKSMEEDLQHGIAGTLGLSSFLSVPAGKLSGGQKKRLSIAAALSNDAPIVILDEPGAALDLEAKEEILQYIDSFVKKGKTVILTSHELPELRMCRTLWILKDGVLNQADSSISAEELVRRF